LTVEECPKEGREAHAQTRAALLTLRASRRAERASGGPGPAFGSVLSTAGFAPPAFGAAAVTFGVMAPAFALAVSAFVPALRAPAGAS
jgi:hypothetical protein